MKIIDIKKEEFNELTKNHPLISFEQSSNWADVKCATGWKGHYIAYIDDDNNYLAFAMFLSKKMPLFNKSLFYAPHGYLIDFEKTALLKDFNKDLVKHLKSKGAFKIIITPNLIYTQRDINGDEVENGENHKHVVQDLIDCGYHHTGFNLYYENLQPRWLFRLALDKPYEELFKKFRYEVRRKVKRKDYLSINVRELERGEISTYKHLMDITSKRRGFVDRPLSYYERMYDMLHKDGMLHYYVAEIDFDKARENVLKEIEKNKAYIAKIKARSNSKHNENIIHEEEVVLNTNETLLKIIDEANKEYGQKVALSGITLITYGKEAIMLLAGNDEKYMQHFATSCIIVTELIKKCINDGFEYYNFYGITGDFNPKNEHYGLYTYKKQYGGEVVELIGQFEYTVSPFYKNVFEVAKKVYNFTKSFKK